MLVYVIGPSGVGKSTLAERVSQELNAVAYANLDEKVKQKDPVLFCHDGSRWEQFWDLALTCLKELKQQYSKALCLVDCGAGCLKTDCALSYFRSQTSVVAILDSPGVVFNRLNSSRPNGYWGTRLLSEYIQEEYSDRRKQFYDAAHHKFDVTGLNEEQAASEFIHFVGRLESS